MIVYVCVFRQESLFLEELVTSHIIIRVFIIIIREVFSFNSTSFCDWFRKLESLSQPIRCKTETNHDLVATFSRAFGSLVVFTSSSHRLLKIFLKDISTIFLDFKHYKPKKDIVNTRCFAFMEQDEFKPGPACIEL